MLHDILRNKFGFENFKPGQQEMRSIMSQQHTVGILPTGSGERVCVINTLRIYQVKKLDINYLTVNIFNG